MIKHDILALLLPLGTVKLIIRALEWESIHTAIPYQTLISGLLYHAKNILQTEYENVSKKDKSTCEKM